MFNLLQAKILHVYGLSFEAGILTGDAARECDQTALNKQLAAFKPSRIYCDASGANYPIGSKRIKGETVFDLKRVVKNEYGILFAYGKWIDFHDPLPESQIAGTTQLSIGALEDAETGWLIVVAEVEMRDRAKALKNQ